MRRALILATAVVALGAARGRAHACDEFGDRPCRTWRVHGGVGMMAGGLGGGDPGEGVMGLAAETGAHLGRLHGRLEGGYALSTGGPAGAATVQRAALGLAVRVLGFGPRRPEPIIQIHVDAGVGGHWRSYVNGGDVLGGEQMIGLGLLMAAPAGDTGRHLLNWMRVRLWRAPGARPAGVCAGDGTCPGVTRDGTDYGVLITWTISAGR